MTNEKDNVTRIIAAILATGGTILLAVSVTAIMISLIILIAGICALFTDFIAGVVSITIWACIFGTFAVGSTFLLGYFCRAGDALPTEKMNRLWIGTMIYNLSGALLTVYTIDGTNIYALTLGAWQILAFGLAAIAFQRDLQKVRVAKMLKMV